MKGRMPDMEGRPLLAATNIKADGKLRGKPLPPRPSQGRGTLDNPVDWCAATKRWWETHRLSAQAKMMTDTDWEMLATAAIIHDQIWGGGSVSHTALANMLSELRQREESVGATVAARYRLKITVATDQTEDEAENDITTAAAKGVDYFERVNRAIAEKRARR